MRQVIIYTGEDGYFVVECPSLPGCVSQGVAKKEAVENIKEAIRGYIAALEEDHLPVPEDRFDAARSRSSTPGVEDNHVVRARIAHGLRERGHVGDVVGVARRRVAGEAGFDVTYLRSRSERRAVQ